MNTDLAGATWFKSSHSGGQTDCVEVAWLGSGRVGVRDSKNPAGPALVLAPNQWNRFTSTVRAGDFNR
ncbi:DUF397 domain-containing protein [Nocardia cyriacigeorgica]|uniref:DUF397 domain-containing protein n=1 Tax=Nocardia cyriacigeorgica TaxID=135487 RepID=A0A6P1DEA2_9NOCA|nr:DUF397 domain-containing protein [Nocardia cyriacigeorgica]NEW42196.1 DUF397 domain-containing protein [Nocardia cyriacigeorgica]NEW47110.1 DUF397 domain-containing protein [Nocardia cyriacigeorgica]NEW53214.1 DUF397 domain-containing protein [Nocardia cyriacigeorgica]NEW55972.1 DUF397 domain-containing protein [Nocardia cyriacigeorgica]